MYEEEERIELFCAKLENLDSVAKALHSELIKSKYRRGSL